MSKLERSSRPMATAIGFMAVLLWASLATLTAFTGQVPPFELTAITFAIGGVLGLVVALCRGRAKLLRPSLPVLCLGVGGLFGEYVLYFGAFRLAPPPQAALIVALWPLMMVLLAAVGLRERLRPTHILGVLVGLAGVLVLTTDTQANLLFTLRFAPGYILAFTAALVWAGYSVLSKRHADVPTETVTSFCLVAALLAVLCHAAWERTVVPTDPKQILAILALGLGPVGGSFFVWDVGVKHGNIRILGILSYAAPILSTALLVATGFAAPRPSLGLACALIVLAAALATMTPRLNLRRLRVGMARSEPRTILGLLLDAQLKG